MTAKELFFIVKGWPKEAWPDHSEFRPAHDGWADAFLVAAMYAPIEAAVLMFEASGLRWLIQSECSVGPILMDHNTNGESPVPFAIKTPRDGVWHRAPTLLHALSAAIQGANR